MAAAPTMSKTTEHLFKKAPLVREAKGTQRYNAGYAVVKAKPKKKELPLPLHGTKLLYQQLLDKALHEHDRQHILTHNQDRLLNRAIEPSEEIYEHPDNASGTRSFEDILKDKILTTHPLSSDVLRDEGRFPASAKNLTERINKIADSLGRSDGSMIRLRLHSENLNDDLVKILASRLSRNKFLQTLMIHNNAITNAGIEILCRSLYSHPCLHVLCVGDNFLSDPAVTSMCRLLAHNKHVSDINMANKWPGRSWLNVEESVHPFISAKGAKIFANTLMSGQCSLTSLSLQFQRVHDEGATALFEALPHCNLRTLNLTNNCLTDQCCAALSTALSENVLLEQLVLATNEITDEGVAVICEGLSTNVFLQALSLAHNKIDTQGMEYLLECLEYNHTLTTLATFQNISSDLRAEDLAHSRKNAYHAEVNDHHDMHEKELAKGVDIADLRGGAGTVPLNTAVGAHTQYEDTHAAERANRDISTATTTDPRTLASLKLGFGANTGRYVSGDNSIVSTAGHTAANTAINTAVNSRVPSRVGSRSGSRSNSPRGCVKVSTLGGVDVDEVEERDGFDMPAALVPPSGNAKATPGSPGSALFGEPTGDRTATPLTPAPPLQRQNSLVQKQLGKFATLAVCEEEVDVGSPPGSASMSRQPSFRRSMSTAGSGLSGGLTAPGSPDRPMTGVMALARATSAHFSSSKSNSRLTTPGSAGLEPPGSGTGSAAGSNSNGGTPDVDALHQLAREHSASSPHRIKGRNVHGAGMFGKRAIHRELSLSNMVIATSPVAPGSRSSGVGMNKQRFDGGIDILDNDEAVKLEQEKEADRLAEIQKVFGGTETTETSSIMVDTTDSNIGGMGSASSDTADDDEESPDKVSPTPTDTRQSGIVDIDAPIHAPSYYAPQLLAGNTNTTHGQVAVFTPTEDYTMSAAHFDYRRYTEQDNVSGVRHFSRSHRTAIQTGSMIQGAHSGSNPGTAGSQDGCSSDSEGSVGSRQALVRTPLVTPHKEGQITTTLTDNDEFTSMSYEDGALAVHEKPSYYGRTKNSHVPGSDAVAPVPTLASIAHKPTHHSTVQHIRSSDLGKSVAVPRIGSSGVMPIKTHSNKYGDSGNHLMYLRTSTLADKRPYVPYSNILHNKDEHARLENDVYGDEVGGMHVYKDGHSRPTSILNIAIEYEKAKRAAIAERQTPAYRARKQDILTASEFVINKQRGSMKPPPDYFWKDWRAKMHLMYPDGIDKAQKASSVRLPPMELPKSGVDAAMYHKIAENNKLYGNCKSPGEVLGIKRTNRLQKIRRAKERAAERAEKEAELKRSLEGGHY